MSSPSLIAREAVSKYPDSNIEQALYFCSSIPSLNSFCHESNDRLVKLGRSLESLVSLKELTLVVFETALEHMMQECLLISSKGKVKVPKVPFGKTDLEMPIVTLGCMRFQQQWGDAIKNMNMVGSDCQDNLIAILKQAIEYGITHIETAKGYGCSEMQLGVALKQLYLTGVCKREDLIIQTKIPAMKDPNVFRSALESSLKNLQVEYLDLFAFHGLNLPQHYEWIFGNDGNNCMEVIREYIVMKKIKHVGFSTHGPTDLIMKAIESDAFDYVNIHYHYFGSYTASGYSPNADDEECGNLTLPELEPMSFGLHWIFAHDSLSEGSPRLHTTTIGAARPCDLDQPAIAAYLHDTNTLACVTKVQNVSQRLKEEADKVLTKEWNASYHKGLPKADQCNTTRVEHNQIMWIHNVIRAFGMYEFGKARYGAFESNQKKWNVDLTPQENVDKMGYGWGFVPGLPLKPGADYSKDLANVPKENLNKIEDAQYFVYKWCTTSDREKEIQKSTGDVMPEEWQTAYDWRTWPDYPDQPSRFHVFDSAGEWSIEILKPLQFALDM